jgi:flagellar assembly protein FliH
MAGVVGCDKAADFERWVLPNIGIPPPAPAASAPAPQPTVFELEEIERVAREEGFAAGLAEGRAAARQQIDEQLARFESLCAAAARPLDALDDMTEQELARLATVMARRVVGRELQLDPSLIELAVREAAAALPSATRDLRVWVHPDDLTLLHELGVTEATWHLGARPTLSRGDCVLESERSRLDARVDTRLAAVIDAVLGNDVDDGVDEVVA